MSVCVTPLVTDYLIVGAGAMGMSFLEELIRSSEDTEARYKSCSWWTLE